MVSVYTLGLLGPFGPIWMAISKYQIQPIPGRKNHDRGASFLARWWVEMMVKKPLITIKMGIFSALKSISHLLPGGFSSIFPKFLFFLEDTDLSDQTRAFFLSSYIAHLWPNCICLLIYTKLGCLLSPLPRLWHKDKTRGGRIRSPQGPLCIGLCGVKQAKISRRIEVFVICHF